MHTATSPIDGKTIAYLQLHPSRPMPRWGILCDICRAARFDIIALPPPFGLGAQQDPFLTGDLYTANPAFYDLAESARSTATVDVVEALSDICRSRGCGLIFDIVIDRADAGGTLVLQNPEFFDTVQSEFLNPRSPRTLTGIAQAHFDDSNVLGRLTALWVGILGSLLAVGASGFRFLNPTALAPHVWRFFNATLRDAFPNMVSLAYTPGMGWGAIARLGDCGFDGVFSSLAWWNLKDGWLAEEFNLLRSAGSVVTSPFILPPQASMLGAEQGVTQNIKFAVASALGDSLLIPLDPSRFTTAHLDPIEKNICAAIEQFARIQGFGTQGELRTLSRKGNAITALSRATLIHQMYTEQAVITLINGDCFRKEEIDVAIDTSYANEARAERLSRIVGDGNPLSALEPGEVRILKAERPAPRAIQKKNVFDAHAALARAIEAPRIVIDTIEPAVGGGSFPTRCVVSELVVVTADIFTDGHPVIAAELKWECVGDRDWQRAPMKLRDNDRWHGEFRPTRVGTYHFSIEAWIDEFASLIRDITLKHEAGADVALDFVEMKAAIKRAAATSKPALRPKLQALLDRLAQASQADALALLAESSAQAVLRAALSRHFVNQSIPMPLEVERAKATFASWYELFPRSASPDAGRHGTFDDVIARLPDIRAMGFDVLYLPPIQPIGKTNRKGRNNSLRGVASDPGSPYAIGAATGGHDALHPELGSFDDFARLIAAAAEQELELALDFAVQCSPDHPWLKDHPEWFRWRADGSLRFAENPPKKYEDIVNIEFYPDAGVAAPLWVALRDIVLFWIEHGIKIFRVDNPHTKPLPFWQWLIAEIRIQYPDVIFLAEAFTRPKMMYRLAQIGFTQSYTYFTWRNTKREITDYLTELTTPPVIEFFRPHFFVNTPDINPFFLQQSGRAGFLIRAVLAATLSGLWGIYSGFELCEAAALPGREEYLDSEKYEIKPRNYAAAGNIKNEISVLNRIRNAHAALQTHRGLTFYNSFNDHVIAYGKALPSRKEIIFVIVNLDPHNIQEATFEMPLWEWKLADHESLCVEDLIQGGAPVIKTGKLQHVRLDPSILPYAIWRLSPVSEARA